jgi:sugar-specific transcriptional regulator TrmB
MLPEMKKTSAEDDDVQILTKLGFTSSQAKIYLAIAQQNQTTVTNVAKKTRMDRAATYRVIRGLEEKGFVLKIIANPLEFKAIPLGELLLALLQRKKSELADTEKELKKLFQQHGNAHIGAAQEEDGSMVLVPKPELIIQQLKKATLSYQKSLDVLFTRQSCLESTAILEKEDWIAMEKGVKFRYVTEKPSKEKPLPEVLKRLNKHPNCCIKYLSIPIKTPVVIEDGKRAWIGATSSTDFLEVPHLWSTNPHIVALAQEYFESMFRQATPYTTNKFSTSLRKP